MKKVLYLSLIITTTSIIAEDLDIILSKITKKREANLPQTTILATPSPMPQLVKKIDNNSTSDQNNTLLQAKEEQLKLTAIMNNSANINGKWYKIGDKIGSYKLKDIMDNAVYLQNNSEQKMLFFDQNHSKINITLGR